MISRRDHQGFTLIELMIVVAIIGILGAIAIPGYVGYRLKAERTVAWTDLQTLRLLEEQFFAENSTYVLGTLTGTAAIQVQMPGFQPDPGSLYTYQTSNPDGAGGDFLAMAARTPATGNDDLSPWTIDNVNNRNSVACVSGSCW